MIFSSFTFRFTLSMTSLTSDRSKSPLAFISDSTKGILGPCTLANDQYERKTKLFEATKRDKIISKISKRGSSSLAFL